MNNCDIIIRGMFLTFKKNKNIEKNKGYEMKFQQEGKWSYDVQREKEAFEKFNRKDRYNACW